MINLYLLLLLVIGLFRGVCEHLVYTKSAINHLYSRTNEYFYYNIQENVMGYNVSHELVNDHSNFIQVLPKINCTVSNYIDSTMGRPDTRILQRHFPRDYLGYINTSAPCLFLMSDNTVQVYYFSGKQSLAYYTSFDLPDQWQCFKPFYINGLVIVDCMHFEKETQRDALFVVNLATRQEKVSESVPKYNTYATNRTKRGISGYSYEDGSLYIFRYQEWSACGDSTNRRNSSVEIWKQETLYDFRLKSIITQVPWAPRQRILLSGFDSYLGDIFLLSKLGYITRMQGCRNYDSRVSFKINLALEIGEVMQCIKVYPEIRLGRRVTTVFAASQRYIYEINWTIRNAPYVQGRYDINNASRVLDITFSVGFIYSLVEYKDSNQTIKISSRGLGSHALTFMDIPINDAQITYIDTAIITNYLYVSSKNRIKAILFQQPLIIFSNPANAEESIFTIRSTSLDIYSGQSEYIYTNISYTIIDRFDTKIYRSVPQLTKFINAQYPSIVTTGIKDLIYGPFVDYKVSTDLAALNSSSMLKFIRVACDFGGMDLSGIIYHKLIPIDYNSTSSYLYVQNTTGYLSFFVCQLKGMQFKCEYYLETYVNETIASIQTLEHRYSIIVLESGNTVVLDHDLNPVNNGWIDAYYDMVKVKIQNNSVLVWIEPNTHALKYYLQGSSTQIRTIDQSYFPKPITPKSLVSAETFPSFLFVNDNHTQVLIIDMSLLVSNSKLSIVSRISPIAQNDSFLEFRFIVSGESLIFFSKDDASLIQEWHINLKEPSFENIRKTYTNFSDFSLNIKCANNYAASMIYRNFYVGALDEDGLPQIVVYQSGLSGNDNFYTKIPLTSQNKNETVIVRGLSFEVLSGDLILISTLSGFEVFIVYQSPMLTFYSFINDSDQIQEHYEFTIRCTDKKSKSEQDVVVKLALFNTQRPISRTSSELVLLDRIQISDSTKDQAFKFYPSELFSGTILFYNIKTQLSNDTDFLQIKTKTAFSLAKGNSSTNVTDIEKRDDLIIIQVNDGIYFVNGTTQVEVLYTPSIYSGYYCPQLEIDTDQDVFISICFDRSYDADTYGKLIVGDFSDRRRSDIL